MRKSLFGSRIVINVTIDVVALIAGLAMIISMLR
jgi:hypothetical protein